MVTRAAGLRWPPEVAEGDASLGPAHPIKEMKNALGLSTDDGSWGKRPRHTG
ncbi:hypothetical protein NDU88_000393, partial [Pleurodeles waltl]